MNGGLNLADWLAIFGLAVAVLGFSVALEQLRRLGSRTRAVESALDAQRREIAGAIFVSRARELESIEGGLRAAVARPARREAERWVLEWRRTAVDAQSFLHAAGDASTELLDVLEVSLGLVDLALEGLADHRIAPADACGRLVIKISTACALARTTANTMMFAGTP